ncbi:MAG: hypothetical protein OEY63_07450, partial [Gemmatimonadota bacterium]|nr:hypothetical protein [Gemmatimonadota bacterium]
AGIDASGQATALGAGQSTVSAQVDAAVGYAMFTASVEPAQAVNMWVDMTHPAAGRNLWGVWGTGSGSAVAVGPTTAMRYGGAAWTQDTDPTATFLFGLTGTSSSDVYATGDQVLHWDGANWNTVADPDGAFMVWGAWSAAPNEIYAVSDGGGIYRYDGTATWDTLFVATVPLYAVWGTSSNEIFAVGGNGTVVSFDGTTWTETPNVGGFTSDIYSIWGVSGTDIFASGFGGILHYDGAWTVQLTTPSFVYGISGTGPSDVYASGWDGTLYHFDGTTWNDTGAHPNQMVGMWSGAGLTLASGATGTLLEGLRDGKVVIAPPVGRDTLIAAQDTVQLYAQTQDGAGNPVTGYLLGWTSLDVSVATVDAAGLVTATGGGTVGIVSTALGGAADTVTIVVGSTGDLLVYSDINVFDNSGMTNVSNKQMAQNLVSFTSSGVRSSSTVVLYDYGRSALWAGPLDTLTATFQANGMTVDSISSASGTLTSIAANVKVLMLWTPKVAYTAAEIATLQQFMKEGGRIVYIGEAGPPYGASGLATENQFLADMGSGMAAPGGGWNSGFQQLPGTSLRDYQVMSGMTEIRMAYSGDLVLSNGDLPLYYDSSETAVLAAVARIMLY